MTALEALIQSVEAPEPCLVEVGEHGLGDELWDQEITIKASDVFLRSRDHFKELAFGAWRNRIAAKVQANQRAAGIPVRTIQEAIHAGETI